MIHPKPCKFPLELLTEDAPHSDGKEYKWILTSTTEDNLTRAGKEAKERFLQRKSCDVSCSPIDWCKGGKCDKNGCYHE